MTTLINGKYPVELLPHRTEFHDARPLWESSRLESMRELVQPGWCIYDVGAEEGDFTALYRSWVGETGTVVAVEPSPGYWPAIRATWEANDFGSAPLCVPAFASSATKYPDPGPHWGLAQEARIAIGDDGWPACSIGEVVPDFGFRHLAQQTANTPQVRLEDLAEDAAPPDAIVLDIEGAEYDALIGCRGWLQPAWLPPGRDRPLVWVSVHDRPLVEWYDKTFLDLHALMCSYDYEGTMLEWRGEGELFWLYRPR